MNCTNCDTTLAIVQGYETCPDCGYVLPLTGSEAVAPHAD
jgi:hypothetical protein